MSAVSFLQRLREIGLKRATSGEVMSRHTSWRIGGPADYFCVVEEEWQLEQIVELARERRLPWLVLGGGNNVLVADQGIEGLVILNRLRGIEIGHDEAGPLARCGAGIFFARAAQFTARKGYAGMEWGIAIPGTVGGGVVTNAGAHWSDVSRSLIFATTLDSAGRRDTLSPDDLAYRYRQSALKSSLINTTNIVVTGCSFRLVADSPAAAQARVEELRQHRIRTQPVKESSAGSTFKNPPGEHAGSLIDRAGLKGHRIGGAQIAPLHANFILNVHAATACDVLALIRLAQSRVREQFGIVLEPEVQLVGRWSADTLQMSEAATL
jgi:UDP-N-acetylmuramate dehydrogenase